MDQYDQSQLSASLAKIPPQVTSHDQTTNQASNQQFHWMDQFSSLSPEKNNELLKITEGISSDIAFPLHSFKSDYEKMVFSIDVTYSLERCHCGGIPCRKYIQQSFRALLTSLLEISPHTQVQAICYANSKLSYMSSGSKYLDVPTALSLLSQRNGAICEESMYDVIFFKNVALKKIFSKEATRLSEIKNNGSTVPQPNKGHSSTSHSIDMRIKQNNDKLASINKDIERNKMHNEGDTLPFFDTIPELSIQLFYLPLLKELQPDAVYIFNDFDHYDLITKPATYAQQFTIDADMFIRSFGDSPTQRNNFVADLPNNTYLGHTPSLCK